MILNLNSNIERVISESAEMKALLSVMATRVAETARQIAPVGHPPDRHPGRFRDSIKSTRNLVYSDDPAAPAIIFGTSDTPPHATLTRAAEANGLRVQKRRP